MSLTFSYPKEQAPNPLARFGSLAHQVPIADIRDQCYVLTDGTLAAVYRLQPFEAGTADLETIGTWDRLLQSMLNAMQPGLQMKVTYRQHHNYRDVIEELRRQGGGTNPFVRLILDDEVDMWRRVMEGKQLIRTEALITLSFKPGRARFRPGMPMQEAVRALLPNAERGWAQRTQAQHASVVRDMEQAIASVVQAMYIAGLNPERLDDDGLATLAYEILNPERALTEPGPTFSGAKATSKIRRPVMDDVMFGRFATAGGKNLLQRERGYRVLAPYSLREQLCHADWRVTENFVRTDGLYTGVVSMRLLPDATHAGLILALLSMPFQMTVTVDVVMLKKQKEAERAWKDARMRESASKATLLNSTAENPQEREEARQAREAYLEMANANQNVFRTRVLVQVMAPTPEALDDGTTLVLQTMRMMNSMTGTRERFAVDSLIKASWPFGLITDMNSRKTLTTHAAALLPTFGSWEGARRPRALFRDPAMRLVKHDPFNIDLANRNKVVVGRSGSGKSFTTQLVDVLPMLAAGAEVMVVDSMASFLATCMASDGRFLRLGPQSDHDHNIFDLPPTFLDLPQKQQDATLVFKISTIGDLVVTMAGLQDEREQVRALAVLSDLVTQMYAELLKEVRDGRRALVANQMPRLRDLHIRMGAYENPDDPGATELIRQVYTDIRRYLVWRTKEGEERVGPYASIFDVHSNFDINTQMTVFEFGEVKDIKDLMNPLALVFINGIIYNRMLSGDRKERVVVLDEAWSLLDHPASRRAINRFYREARKLNGAVTLITQSYADLDNEIGRPLLDNATITYFLRHEKNEKTAAAMTKSGVNDRRRDAIFDLQQVKGKYSEIMLKMDSAWGVVRLEPTPLKYWMATTDPPDLKKRDEYLALYHDGWGLTWAQVLLILSQDYPVGVAADKGGQKLSEYAALAIAERFALRLAEMEGRLRLEREKRAA